MFESDRFFSTTAALYIPSRDASHRPSSAPPTHADSSIAQPAMAARPAASSAATAAPFAFPPFYSFPPFFTSVTMRASARHTCSTAAASPFSLPSLRLACRCDPILPTRVVADIRCGGGVRVMGLLSLCSVQPVESTWLKQRALWLDLIRAYALHYQLTRISLSLYRPHAAAGGAGATSAVAATAAAPASSSTGASTSRDAQLINALFRNDAIDRQLSVDTVRTLLDALSADSWGVWEDSDMYSGSGGGAAGRSSFLLSAGRRISEVSEAIWAHMQSIGESAGIVTLYELRTGDSMKRASFFGVDETILLHAVRHLESRGKAAVIPAPLVSEVGVKFLG